MIPETVTAGDIFSRIFSNNFSLDDVSSLSEDSEGSLAGTLGIIATHQFTPERTKEERIQFAEKLISKIDGASLSKKANYDIASGLGNCGSREKNSVAAAILKKMVESKKFDVGVVFVIGKEKKDALEATVQQSVVSEIRKWAITQSHDQLNKFFKEHPKGDAELYEANKEIAMILLSSGQIAGFEGETGVEMAEKIERGEFDFRAFVGRNIPNRDQSRIEAWSKAQLESSSIEEIEVKNSSSILGTLVSAICCFSSSRLSSDSRYRNPSERS